jgi:hypothetical protein
VNTTWPQVDQDARTIDPTPGIDHLLQVRAEGWIPLTQIPQKPTLGIAKVYNWIGEHYVGSINTGNGVRVLVKKWQYYEDHGRRE